LLATLCAASIAAAAFGAVHVDLWTVLFSSRAAPAERAIVFLLRLPRIILAALVGGALAVTGVAFQALLRNPLADPYVLGVAGGASAGGVLALWLGVGVGWTQGHALVVPTCAFLGALFAVILVERLATDHGHLNVLTALLSGAILNAVSAALVYFIESIASLTQLHSIVFYLMGSMSSPSYAALSALAVTVLCAVSGLWILSRQFNALSLGEQGALQLGVEVDHVKRMTLILGSLLTGVSVAMAGPIGFVGLIVPHGLRFVLGSDHRLLVPMAFLGGGAFLVLSDLAARSVLAPVELPVGVVTAILGGPFFLYLLRQKGPGRGER
jgi:iron complex transport system permease protein